MARVAVFGGSFNPIHYGHLLLADEVLELLGARPRALRARPRVPPHKPPAELAPAADRFAMVRLAIAGHAGFAVSDLELRRPGPSYTVDTLTALAAGGDELFLVDRLRDVPRSADAGASRGASPRWPGWS